MRKQWRVIRVNAFATRKREKKKINKNKKNKNKKRISMLFMSLFGIILSRFSAQRSTSSKQNIHLHVHAYTYNGRTDRQKTVYIRGHGKTWYFFHIEIEIYAFSRVIISQKYIWSLYYLRFKKIEGQKGQIAYFFLNVKKRFIIVLQNLKIYIYI